jgi:DNA polymerase III alpha subunit
LCFANAYEEAADLLKTKEPLLIIGRALVEEADEEGVAQKPKMRLKEACLLADAEINRTSRLKIDARSATIDSKCLLEMNRIIQKFPGEKPVYLSLNDNDLEVEMLFSSSRKVKPTEELIHALEQAIPNIKVGRE